MVRGDTEDFDAIILDLGLPTMDGLTVLRRWRKAKRLAPVLILTARGNWDERVEGIEAGADDYVAKPFRMEEVVARIRALIRRSGGFASSRLEIGDLVLDLKTMQVSREGVPIGLTPQEYRLVAFLAHRRGQVVSQAEITEHLRPGFRTRIELHRGPRRPRAQEAGDRLHQDASRIWLRPCGDT